MKRKEREKPFLGHVSSQYPTLRSMKDGRLQTMRPKRKKIEKKAFVEFESFPSCLELSSIFCEVKTFGLISG